MHRIAMVFMLLPLGLTSPQVDNAPPKDWTLPQNKNWHWHPLPIPASELSARLTFKGHAPSKLIGGYNLSLVEVLWVPKTAYSEASVIPKNRQLLHLRYISDDDVLDVVEAKNIAKGPGFFCDWAYNAQCFITLKRGTSKEGRPNRVFGISKECDAMMISKNKTGEQVDKLNNELMASPLIGH